MKHIIDYGINAPFHTLPAKRAFAKSNNGEPMFEWCTQRMIWDGKKFEVCTPIMLHEIIKANQ